MHAEAWAWANGLLGVLPGVGRVVEFGSRNVNGSVRQSRPYGPADSWWHFLCGPGKWVGIDLVAGPGVDVVADAADWDGGGGFDAVVCTEVLEHTARWSDLIASAARAVRPGGFLILTCAGPGRPPHSGVDGGPLRPGEHYANPDPADLYACLVAHFRAAVVVDQPTTCDLYALASR